MQVKRTTVREVKKWFKTLEENRYKKTYNSDARRVAWFVNNPLSEVEGMPKTLTKKWKMTEYKREKYLARKFLESMLRKKRERAKISEGKLNEAGYGDIGIGFLIDQLVNAMEHYSEKEFIQHMGKQLEMNPKVAKRVYKNYWKISPQNRQKWHPQNWEKWLAKQGIKESKITEIKLRQIIREIIEGEELDKAKEKHKDEKEQQKTKHEDEKADAREKDFETRQKELKK